MRLKPSVEKELSKLPKNECYKILLALTELSKNPFLGKKLKGEFKNQHSLRVWPYRIIYQIQKNDLLILIVRIGHRQEVYK